MRSRVPKLFEVVILRRDRPASGLVRGQKGTVVDVLGNGAAFEVEFIDSHGRTLGVETVQAADVQHARHEVPAAG
jgi:hypothetical protein